MHSEIFCKLVWAVFHYKFKKQSFILIYICLLRFETQSFPFLLIHKTVEKKVKKVRHVNIIAANLILHAQPDVYLYSYRTA